MPVLVCDRVCMRVARARTHKRTHTRGCACVRVRVRAAASLGGARTFACVLALFMRAFASTKQFTRLDRNNL
jgi:hypothetical protein